MKKITSIVVGLLMVGVYADFSQAQEKEKEGARRPEARKEGDGQRRPEGQRRPDGQRPPGAQGQRPGGRGPGGPGGRGPGGPGGFQSMMARLPVYAALDVDKDGTLSEKEIANATAALKKLDKNKDGKLDESELRPSFGGRGPGGPGGRPGAADGQGRPRRPGGDADGQGRPRRPGGENDKRPERPARPDNN